MSSQEVVLIVGGVIELWFALGLYECMRLKNPLTGTMVWMMVVVAVIGAILYAVL